jgi:hypothetical protein
MSANESQEIIANCLCTYFYPNHPYLLISYIAMGAKDYLVKPIRINECKGLVDKMKK